MTPLPGKCPSCGSTERRETPRGGYTFFRYHPPTVHIRKLGTAAKAHNEAQLERARKAAAAPATEIVMCAKCGALYGVEGVKRKIPELEPKPEEG